MHLFLTGDESVRSEHVMRVCRSIGWHLPLEHDPDGLIDWKLSPLNVIRKIGVKERDIVKSRWLGGLIWMTRPRSLSQSGKKGLKHWQTLWIVGFAGSIGSSSRGCQVCGS